MIAAAFNEDGLGEGTVLTCTSEGFEDSAFWFKVKGQKHSVSKVKVLAPVDIERVNGVRELVSNTVTEARCEQGIQKLREANLPLDRSSLGTYLRFIVNDIIKEESDTILKNGLTIKEIGGPVSNAAKTWFFKNEDKFE